MPSGPTSKDLTCPASAAVRPASPGAGPRPSPPRWVRSPSSAPGITASSATRASARATARSGWRTPACRQRHCACSASPRPGPASLSTSTLLRELAGLTVAPKTVERHAEALGREVAADEVRVIDPEPCEARTLYLGLDGTGVPARKGEVEGRCAKQPDGTAKTREAERRGFDTAPRRVVLGDGAPWIWNFADEHFPGAVQIVDIFQYAEFRIMRRVVLNWLIPFASCLVFST